MGMIILFSVICSFPVISVKVVSAQPNALGTAWTTMEPITGTGCCDKGWHKYKGNCYFFSSIPAAWHDAKGKCEQKRANLASIHSPLEQYFIAGRIESTYWIGLNLKKHERSWKWADGSKTSLYQKWNPTSPNPRSREGCVSIYWQTLGEWNHDSCYHSYPYICQKGVTSAETCQRAKLTFKDTYYYFSDFPLNWYQAQLYCEREKAHLAIIRNQEDQKFIKENKIFDFNHWIGLSDWQDESNWLWVNGAQLSGYTNWKTSEPNNARSNEDCVFMYPAGHWNDSPCEDRYYFICQTID